MSEVEFFTKDVRIVREVTYMASLLLTLNRVPGMLSERTYQSTVWLCKQTRHEI